jgi:hypothetical protein
MDQQFLNSLKNSTPVIQDLQTYMDADDEILTIAQYVVKHNQHNEYVVPERIKFLYSPKPKKDGGRYSLFDLIKRSEIEKMVNDEYDFILTIFYDVWSKLDPEQKIIQLDKALCGIDMGDGEEIDKLKKKAPDSKEYVSNMYFYGAEKVMKISEIVDLSCASAMEERKEKEKNAKKAKNTVEEQI